MTGATLGRLLKSGQSYQGKGRKSTFLTEDEEKIITHRLLEMANGAQVLNLSIVKQWCIYTRLPGVLYCEPPEQSTRVPLRRLGWRDTCLGCQVVTMMLWALMIMMMP